MVLSLLTFLLLLLPIVASAQTIPVELGAFVETGAVNSVSGAGLVTCTPTTGSVVCTGTGASSITGTANQISRDVATGAVTLSLPSVVVAPGSLAVTTRTGTPATFACFDSS